MVDQIVDALLAGAAAVGGMGGKVMVEKTVGDTYGALKGALSRRLGAGSKAVQAVAELDDNPGSEPRRGVVREEIAAAALGDDPEILLAARRLLEVLGSLPPDRRAAVQQAVGTGINQASGGSTITVTNSPR